MRAQRFFYSQTQSDPYCSSEMSVNSKSEPTWERALFKFIHRTERKTSLV